MSLLKHTENMFCFDLKEQLAKLTKLNFRSLSSFFKSKIYHTTSPCSAVNRLSFAVNGGSVCLFA